MESEPLISLLWSWVKPLVLANRYYDVGIIHCPGESKVEVTTDCYFLITYFSISLISPKEDRTQWFFFSSEKPKETTVWKKITAFVNIQASTYTFLKLVNKSVNTFYCLCFCYQKLNGKFYILIYCFKMMFQVSDLLCEIFFLLLFLGHF